MPYVKVRNGRRITCAAPGELARFAPAVGEFATTERLNDTQIGARLGLTGNQVRGIRARNGIPAAHPRGRPRKSTTTAITEGEAP